MPRRRSYLLIRSTGCDNNDPARRQTQNPSAVCRRAKKFRVERTTATTSGRASGVLVRRTIRLPRRRRSRCSLRIGRTGFRFVVGTGTRIASFRILLASGFALTRRTILRSCGWRYRLRFMSRGSDLCRRAFVGSNRRRRRIRFGLICWRYRLRFVSRGSDLCRRTTVRCDLRRRRIRRRLIRRYWRRWIRCG